ncbi:MAG: hypothetical protein COA96_04505 [SAR86 cluster bacterium]|uniref:Peptidase C-terminal archaeal/bacterial domain-containing protein n=1 Tax=SAR86 cluster bacterium TaxID=2030880 RepID=A0A2A5B606_9GAMM|nr:MAG: hypothetical protein COA96_04505 [SAR86 cluster bacterium]
MNLRLTSTIKRIACFSISLGFATVLSTWATFVYPQDIFDDPNYGSLTLSAGFTPDPQVKRLVAGGSTEFDTCVGYFSGSPDLNLHYEPGDFDLGIFAKSGVDTTIAINAPNGDWICNDDSDDMSDSNPGVLIRNPQSGLYNIWVGVYSESDAFESASLAITELTVSDWNDMDLSENIPDSSSLDIFANPTYGSLTLAAGFSPDPSVTTLTAGGSVSATECSGYFTASPDLNLSYEAGNFALGIFAKAGEDTTIAVNDPDGNWICNDDSSYLTDSNPAVLIEDPSSGIYNIWVGTYSETGSPSTQLVITELGTANWDGLDLDAVSDPEPEPEPVRVIEPEPVDDVVEIILLTPSRVQFGRKNN